MKSTPLVSIGVPVYNGDTYLSECLESIHAQTYQNWECVIVNNLSTDKSFSIAESYAAKDNRFKVITNKEFVDMITNFNNAFRFSNKDATYFKVVCADDWIFPEFLERMVEVMEQNVRTGICSSYRIDHIKVRCDYLNIMDGPVFDGKEILLQQLKNTINVTGSETTVLWRVEALKKIKNYPVIFSDNKYHFDTKLAHELLSFSDLGFVFQVLSYTRRHEGTFTSQATTKLNTSINLREEELFTYKSIFPELESEYKKVRADYGIFLIKNKIRRNKESLKWHKEHLNKTRRFGILELISILLMRFFQKLMNK